MPKTVLIVGASVAGVGAATELRRCGFDGAIVLVDAQPHLPYDRPPLSKGVLVGGATVESISLLPREEFETLGIELRLGQEVVAVDADERAITLRSGERLRGDWIILAAGARARTLPESAGCEGIITVRDLADGLALRERLQSAKSIAVIGGGFVGAEVASSARALGLDATVVELDELPFIRILGRTVAERLARLHVANGVDLRTGVKVDKVARLPNNRFFLTLSDGATIVTDIVVAGLGAIPNLEFLQGSGIELGNGVLCDAQGRTSKPGIYATGDMANWTPRDGEERHRDEHWTCAREHARIVAHDICAKQGPAWSEYLPYFWSDMHGKRIQMLGTARATDTVRFVYEDAAKGAFLAEVGRDGRLVAVIGCNAAVRLMKYRAILPARPAFETREETVQGAVA